METSLMNLLCSTPSCRIQPGPSSSQGKASGGSSFSSILHGSLNQGHGTTFCGSTAPEISPPTKSLASDDALSRSLDVIDALAYLPVLLAAQSQVNSAQTDIGNALFSPDDVESLLDAIANALETGDTEGLRKTLGENKGLQSLLSRQEAGAASLLRSQAQDTSDQAGNALQGWDSVSNAIASLIAALDAVNGGTSAESPQSIRNYGMTETPSRDGEGAASGEKSGKKETEITSSAAGSDDAPGNTMFPGVVLPNLLAKTDTAVEHSTPPETSSTEVSSGLSSFLAQQERAYQGAGMKADGTASRAGSSKGDNQPKGANSLFEDDAVPGEAKTDRSSGTVSAPGKIFEVLYARAEDTSGSSKNTGETSARLDGSIQGERHKTVAPGDIPVKQTVQGQGQAQEKQVEAEKTGSAAGKAVLAEETVFEDLKSRKEKSSHSDESAGPSDSNEKANVLIHDSTKATTSAQKSGQTGQAAPSQASAMIHKIEELAESYSSRNQSADMVLRLKVDEKESLVVGLRSQGDRVVVDVKGASDGLMSALQSQKDSITRELESKQIYTTINVEINGDGNPKRQGQGQRQNRNGKEDNETDFGGIFNTLT